MCARIGIAYFVCCKVSMCFISVYGAFWRNNE